MVNRSRLYLYGQVFDQIGDLAETDYILTYGSPYAAGFSRMISPAMRRAVDSIEPMG